MYCVRIGLSVLDGEGICDDNIRKRDDVVIHKACHDGLAIDVEFWDWKEFKYLMRPHKMTLLTK